VEASGDGAGTVPEMGLEKVLEKVPEKVQGKVPGMVTGRCKQYSDDGALVAIGSANCGAVCVRPHVDSGGVCH
jgi:hypothetical protein